MITQLDEDIEKRSALKVCCIYIAIAKTYEDALVKYGFHRQEVESVMNQWFVDGPANLLANIEEAQLNAILQMEYGGPLILNESNMNAYMKMDELIFKKGCELFAEKFGSFGKQHYNRKDAKQFKNAMSEIQQSMTGSSCFSWAGLRTLETAMLLYFNFLEEKKEYFTERTTFLHDLEAYYCDPNQPIHKSGITQDEIPSQKISDWDSLWNYDDINRKNHLLKLFEWQMIKTCINGAESKKDKDALRKCNKQLVLELCKKNLTDFKNNNRAMFEEYLMLYNRYYPNFNVVETKYSLTKSYICANRSWVRNCLHRINVLPFDITAGIYKENKLLRNADSDIKNAQYPLSLIKVYEGNELFSHFVHEKALTQMSYQQNCQRKIFITFNIIPIENALEIDDMVQGETLPDPGDKEEENSTFTRYPVSQSKKNVTLTPRSKDIYPSKAAGRKKKMPGAAKKPPVIKKAINCQDKKHVVGSPLDGNNTVWSTPTAVQAVATVQAAPQTAADTQTAATAPTVATVLAVPNAQAEAYMKKINLQLAEFAKWRSKRGRHTFGAADASLKAAPTNEDEMPPSTNPRNKKAGQRFVERSNARRMRWQDFYHRNNELFCKGYNKENGNVFKNETAGVKMC